MAKGLHMCGRPHRARTCSRSPLVPAIAHNSISDSYSEKATI